MVRHRVATIGQNTRRQKPSAQTSYPAAESTDDPRGRSPKPAHCRNRRVSEDGGSAQVLTVPAQAPPSHSYSTQSRAVLDGRSSPETATISPCRPNFEFKNSAMNSGNTPWCSSAPSAATNVTPIRTHLASSAGGTVAWMTSSSGCVVQNVAKRIARGALLRHTNPADIRHCRDDPPDLDAAPRQRRVAHLFARADRALIGRVALFARRAASG
jgi:hypothetical protein